MKYFKCNGCCSNSVGSAKPCFICVDGETFPEVCLESHDKECCSPNWQPITKEEFLKETK